MFFEEGSMLKKSHAAGSIALCLISLLAGGCDLGLDPYADDNPGEGYMSRATADQVFTWGTAKGGVEIVKFRSAAELQAYLTGTSRQSSGTASFLVINRIDGDPVVRIADRAFSPAARGGADDITTVVSAVKLPESIESLGANLFAGVTKPVTVSIPPAVAEKIPPGELQSAAGDRATIQKVDPGNPSKAPEVIVRGPSGGGGSSSGSSSSGKGNETPSGNEETPGEDEEETPNTPAPPEPPAPPPPPVPELIAGQPVVTYSGASGSLTLSAAYTFDMKVKLTASPAGWTVTGDGTATITATPNNQVTGEAVKLSFTVGNFDVQDRTTTIPETTLMPVSTEFTPQSGKTYTVRYADRHGAVNLKEEGGTDGWYYVGETRYKRVFNAVYTPNAPDSPRDGIGEGKSTIAYTTANKAEMSDRVLALFKIRFGSSSSEDRVEITGTDLPSAPNAGFDTQIVIDIGLPAASGSTLDEEDNSRLPVFSIPDRGLGTPGGSYDHIRFRVNWGTSLVIKADNSPYINNGDPCPPGNLTGATVEVMSRGKLRSGAYEGEPLGKDAIIIALNGSAIALGPESSFGPGTSGYNQTRDEWYSGWFIGPNGDSPRILWDGGDQTGNYLEIQGNHLAFDASITVRKSIRLPYDVWFASGPTLTIDVSGSGTRGLFAKSGGERFYGTASSSGGFHVGNPASTIIIRRGNSLSRSFVTGSGSGTITAGSSDIEIRNGGKGKAGTAGETPVYYRVKPRNQIGGYFNWPVP
jgi:hypothetical protein